MTTMETMEMEQFICSVFSLPKKCYPRFNNFQKQLLSIGQRFQVTLEKFHRLTQTQATKDLQQIRQTVNDLADSPAVQVAIFGKFHDEISSCNLVTTKDSKYLTPDCVPSRLTRNDWINRSTQFSDAEGEPVAHVYIVYVDKKNKLKELAQNIQKDISSLCLPSFKNLLLLVGLDPSLARENSSMKSFEKDLRNVFHNTTKENIHGKGEGPEKEYHVYFKSSSYEDLISSEGELPKLIQTHLEWKVIQALLDMRELIESNTRIYRKNSQETFQGPVAFEECLKKRFLETFLKNRRYILDTVLGKFFFQEGIMDHDKIAQVLLENLAHVLQCLTVEVLAKIYGIKEYHLHEMLEETVFKEECSTIIGCYIRENLLRLLPPCFFNYECNNLQNERDRLSDLFSNTHHKTFLDGLKKIQETDWMHIANIVHQELEAKVKPTERNLLIQHKQKFEINSILKQTMASNYKSYQLPPSTGPTEELKHDLQRIDGVEGVAMVCGELQVHVTNFSSVENEKEVLQEINQVITRYKYRQSYKIGIITRKPKLYYSVGSTLHCCVLNRRGTLGGFVIDTDGKLYFLTCAHIVPNNVDVHVEIRGQQVGPITIGRSVIMQVPAMNRHISVDCCDIMAVRVNAHQIPRCIPFFKTADGEFGSSVMVQPFDRSLEELHDVYKWGATTNLTHGLLHTGDYNKELFVSCNLNDHKYIYVLVETPPVDDDNHGPFALLGDSGAIICAEIEDKIQIIAMIQGGDMSITTGPLLANYTIGFYLWCGLDKLFKRSHLNLTIVPFSEQNL